jgi:hypothetical protein
MKQKEYKNFFKTDINRAYQRALKKLQPQLTEEDKQLMTTLPKKIDTEDTFFKTMLKIHSNPSIWTVIYISLNDELQRFCEEP